MFVFRNDAGKSLRIGFAPLHGNDENEILVVFNLGWTQGEIVSTCSSKRKLELERSIKNHIDNNVKSIEFINEAGDIDFQISRCSLGQGELKAVLSPGMIDDDQIEFGFKGFLITESNNWGQS